MYSSALEHDSVMETQAEIAARSRCLRSRAHPEHQWRLDLDLHAPEAMLQGRFRARAACQRRTKVLLDWEWCFRRWLSDVRQRGISISGAEPRRWTEYLSDELRPERRTPEGAQRASTTYRRAAEDPRYHSSVLGYFKAPTVRRIAADYISKPNLPTSRASWCSRTGQTVVS